MVPVISRSLLWEKQKNNSRVVVVAAISKRLLAQKQESNISINAVAARPKVLGQGSKKLAVAAKTN
jgi:hypothetical protein